MKWAIVLVVMAACACGAWAQAPAASSTNSDEISGMYTFLQEGEFVQINLEEGSRITGFISRYGDSTGDKGAFLDQMFTRGELKGSHVHFVTRVVHGVSYEFDGDAARGDAKSASDEGYRVLRGKLTQYTEDENKKTTAKSREVTLKSFPQDAMAYHSAKD
ncbi:MAG TPA: hypothetical protein VHA14_09320 [Bryobacteraceae bacterium]|nr:hypothetical protein [Bryobacteraceae bacterium]